MTDTAALMLVLAGLHTMESCLIVPDGAVAFVQGITGRYTPVHASKLMRMRRGRFLFLNPLQPRAHVLNAGLPHLLLTAEGVLDAAPEEDNAPRRRPLVSWAAVGPVHASEAGLVCPGLGAVPCGCTRNARLWARVINAMRTAPPARRAVLTERWLRLRFSEAIVANRISRLRKACAPLDAASSVLFTLLAAAGIAASFRHAPEVLIAFLALGVLAGFILAGCYWRAHRLLRPRAFAERLGHAALMAVCFPIAFRARSTLGRDAIAHAHPAAAAADLLPAKQKAAVLARLIRQWTFRSSPPVFGSTEDRVLGQAAESVLAHLQLKLSDGKIDPSAFSKQPSFDDASIRSWCPRCHATYVHGSGTCADCAGVALLPVPPRAETTAR